VGIGKQAKTLSRKQVEMICSHLGKNTQSGKRNQLIFLFTVKTGLRAKEVALLRWEMVLTSDGEIGHTLSLPNTASKGRSGRVVPLHSDVRSILSDLYAEAGNRTLLPADRIIHSQRSKRVSPQVIVNMFQRWYRDMGLVGCSSHSGRRTFITEAAKRVSQVGGSLRDVQVMAGHSSLQTTQRYIDYDTESQRKLINLL
jgi:integrase/recombinase XerD